MPYPKIRTSWIEDLQKAPCPFPDTAGVQLLTAQELQAFTLLARGLKIEEVAPLMHRQKRNTELTVSPERVKDYLREIYLKLGINSREQLVSIAAATGHLKLATGDALDNLIESYNELPSRPREVLPYAALGYTNEEAATILGSSRHTIADHLKTIYSQLGVHNAAELTAAYLAMLSEANKLSASPAQEKAKPTALVQAPTPAPAASPLYASSQTVHPVITKPVKQRWVSDIELRRLRRERESNMMGQNPW